MARDGIVTSPDGDRWSLRRRWSERPLPRIWRRFRKSGEEAEDAGLVPEVDAIAEVGLSEFGWVRLAIAAGGPPERISAGERTELPRPRHEVGA
jgi:hypothetical protein